MVCFMGTISTSKRRGKFDAHLSMFKGGFSHTKITPTSLHSTRFIWFSVEKPESFFGISGVSGFSNSLRLCSTSIYALSTRLHLKLCVNQIKLSQFFSFSFLIIFSNLVLLFMYFYFPTWVRFKWDFISSFTTDYFFPNLFIFFSHLKLSSNVFISVFHFITH